MACPILGPKCSAYYMIISVWGVFMLALMGVFFKIRSPALFEDLKMDEKEWFEHIKNSTEGHDKGLDYIQEKYDDNAINCWIAAGLYAILFVFSLVQQRMNARQSYEMA